MSLSMRCSGTRGLAQLASRSSLASASAPATAACRPAAQSARIFSATTAFRAATVAPPSHASATASSAASSAASPSSGSGSVSGGTAVVLLNMGGPATIPEVRPFLERLFSDGEIIQLGRMQGWLGPLIAKRRTPKIEEQYAAIGGSPIRRWTELQGKEMAKRLDKLSPSTAPHKPYVCFRYADPLTSAALQQMADDGVTRAVAFSQYPQFSCTTTGSSLNHLWRELKRMGMEKRFTWSLIDRWHEHPLFIAAVKRRIDMALSEFPEEERAKFLIVFSAHSLPMRVVAKGDSYVQEVSSTVGAVMRELNHSNRYILAWQSQVGFLPWMGPQTGEVLQGLGKQGHRHVLVVPIAFTSDHVETLFEIDVEYAHVAKEAGITHFRRSPSLNDEPLLADAMAELVHAHLQSGEVCSVQYPLNCAQCDNPICKSVCNPVKPYTKLRDAAMPDGELALANPIKY